MQPYLFIIRGLPGVGKTTLAKTLASHVFSADDYFTDAEGRYTFDHTKLIEAHHMCLLSVMDATYHFRGENIAVANTFVRKDHMNPYILHAYSVNYNPVIISLGAGGMSPEGLHARCIHSVPLETIQRMLREYEQ